jgi:hypothetical protein
MSPIVNFSCDVTNTDFSAGLGLEIWLDDSKIFDQDWIKESTKFSYDFSDDDVSHTIKFTMKNKTRRHTQCDATGAIVKDARLIISNIAFDEIELGQIVPNLSVYEHDFNGTGNKTQDKFYSEMGCNGTVTLPFATPVYLWLLENM